jgi:SRSO17 transposase
VEGQNIQHFMSHSPWSGDAVCEHVQEELKAMSELTTGGVLLVDESADEKASGKSAGAAKQYNGRLGKVETRQVGVFLSYVNLKVGQGLWTWITGKLFLPEAWFNESHQSLRERLGIPDSLVFKTKIELAWEAIQELIDRHLPFEIVGFDTLYGRSAGLRAQIRNTGARYMAEVPVDTQVYREPPKRGIPERTCKKGRAPSQRRVLNGEAVRVDTLRAPREGRRLQIRVTERGVLCDRFMARRVWTVYQETVVEDWRVIREESDGHTRYALCNAAADTPLKQLAWWKCQRYFIERSNQDAKSELGWDELQAQKYLAWGHHLALTVLAAWFVAQTQYEWARDYPRDPALLNQLEMEVLPALSVANVRELLRSVMPLQRLTEEQAIERVIEHLSNRTRSRKSRLKKQRLVQMSQIGSG